MKRTAINLLWAATILAGLFLCFYYFTAPPGESSLIKNFSAHRAVYEQLRDMLQEDAGLRRLDNWGVETRDGMSKPPAGHFPIERYNKYLALLKEAHALGASSEEGEHPMANLLVWVSGFAGDMVHIGICWMTEPPSRQVTSLNAFLRDGKSSGTKGPVFQHIDSNWYLWTDIRTN